MRAQNFVTRQLVDLLIYLLVPGLSLLLPASWSRALVVYLARRQWIMPQAAEAAWNGAKDLLGLQHEKAFKQRWRLVTLLEARDLFLLQFGRSATVLAEIEHKQPLELVKDRVLIGMHWGPSIAILKLLQAAGQQPALPYRPTQKDVIRHRPFYYFYTTLVGRYLVATMADRAVPVGGSGRKIRAMLDQPGSIIVVMDAPPLEGRPTLKQEVLDRDASFDAGFATTLARQGKEYVFYALSLEAGDSALKILELKGPFSSDSAQEFLQRYAGFLGDHLASDPAQWRIWQAAQQFWNGDARVPSSE